MEIPFWIFFIILFLATAMAMLFMEIADKGFRGFIDQFVDHKEDPEGPWCVPVQYGNGYVSQDSIGFSTEDFQRMSDCNG